MRELVGVSGPVSSRGRLRKIATAGFPAIALAVAAFLALGTASAVSSTLGWTNISIAGEPGNLQTVAFEGGIFLAASDISGRCHRSTNGVDWVLMNVRTTTPMRSFAYGGGRWVGVGESGRVIDSTNGHDWQSRRPTTKLLTGVVYGGGRFFIVGSNYRASSVDGISWDEDSDTAAIRWNAVVRADVRFIAIGAKARYAFSNGSVRDWTVYALINLSLNDPDFHAICRGPDRYITVGEGGVIYGSADTLLWDLHRTDTQGPDLLAVGYGVGWYVTAGVAGTMLVSSDGRLWTPETSGTTASLRGVAYGNGRFLAVGDGGVLLRSRDLSPGTIRFTTAALAVGEEVGKAHLTVVREGGSFGAAEVRYSTLAGTAQSGEDFNPTDGILQWADGESGGKSLEIPVVDDLAEEDSEQFTVALSAPVGAALLVPSSAVVTITGPNDTPPPEGVSAPTIVRHPESVRIGLGGIARLEAQASGAPPLRFQWLKNGQPLPGETDSVLTISGIQLVNGGRYTVVVSNAGGSTLSDPADLVIDVAPIWLADRFADRLVYSEGTRSGGTNNLSATLESEAKEPKHAGKSGRHSLWMTWRAPATGRATFSTVGSAFDTLLAVYKGNAVASLTEWASDEDSGGSLTSQVQFPAEQGVEYQIAVDGFAGATGNVILSWRLEDTVPAVPRIVAPPASLSVTNGGVATFVVQAEGEALTYQWRSNHVVIVGATNSALTLPVITEAHAGVYSVRVSRGDNAGVFVDTPGALLEVTSRPGNAAARDKLDDLFPEPTGASLALHADGGGSGYSSIGAGSTLIVHEHNQDAQKSPGDPIVHGDVGGASLWLRLRVPENGLLELSTTNSEIDVVLGVYLDRKKFVEVAKDIGEGRARPARVLFAVGLEVDYLVMLDGAKGSRGRIQLTASRPPAVIAPWEPMLKKNTNGLLVLRQAVRPGRHELRVGDDPLAFTRLMVTNVDGGMFEFSEPFAPAVPRRFYHVLSLGEPGK